MMLLRRFFIFGMFLISTQCWAAEIVGLEDFLKMVRDQNQSLQSADAQAKGAAGLAREADLVFSPKLTTDLRTGYDENVAAPAIIGYDKALTDAFSAALTQQFSFGLQAKLSYTLTKSKLDGIDLALTRGVDQFSAGTASIELSLPLWANGFGRTARATEELTRQQNLASQYSALSQRDAILMDAENVYWKLAAALEQLKIEEQSVKSAVSIQTYVKGKQKKDLGEQADVIQADALVEAYGLQLQLAQNNVRTAQRQFNTLLNREALQPVPTLAPLNFSTLKSISVPIERPGDSNAVKATQAQAQLANASSIVARERNRPSLDVYTAYSAYGQNAEPSEALSDSLKAKKDGAYAGLRFTVPLNIGAINEAASGAEQNRIAAEKSLSYATYQQDQQWTELVQTMIDARKTLELSEKIEFIQKSKVEQERERLRRGRTTTYQVLLFEQDYNKSQGTRVQTATLLLSLQAKAKIYQTGSEGVK